MQSLQWGEFNKLLGQEVVCCPELSLQIYIRREPRTGAGFGYVPRGPRPTDAQVVALQNLALVHDCLAIKIEPDTGWFLPLAAPEQEDERTLERVLSQNGARLGRRMLPGATFIIDLRVDEQQLLKRLPSITRYNIGLARRHGVSVEYDQSEQGFEEFLSLFQAEVAPRMPLAVRHSPEHLRNHWRTVGQSGWVYILKAKYQGELCAAMLLMQFNGRLYYPYGASQRENSRVKASTLLMWEAICFGQKLNCSDFDLWTAMDCDSFSAVGPQAYEGVHRFAARFGGQWKKLMAAWDIVPLAKP